MNGIEWIVSQELKRQKIYDPKFLVVGKGQKYSLADKEMAYQMVLDGAPYSEVEKAYGLSKSTIKRIVRLKRNKKD